MPIPTLLIYDDRFLAHGVDWHPENAARLEAVSRHLRSRGLWQRMASLPFDAASDEQLAWLHTEEYIEEIRAVCAGGGFEIAPDTPVSQTSFEAAALAAGGCIAAVEAILDGASSTALCLVRPPGHHALPDRGHGFCLFNNAALAAEAALRQGLERMAILDFDLHHGDGTQEMFYHRGDVMYCSVHEHPLFPMTGGLDEVAASTRARRRPLMCRCRRGPGTGTTPRSSGASSSPCWASTGRSSSSSPPGMTRTTLTP
jgi:acetoin utilization deacetylase AcuC-like enzyme